MADIAASVLTRLKNKAQASGRIKSDFRYSVNIVYNNFPWPTPTAEQKAKSSILHRQFWTQDQSIPIVLSQICMTKFLCHPNCARLTKQMTVP